MSWVADGVRRATRPQTCPLSTTFCFTVTQAPTEDPWEYRRGLWTEDKGPRATSTSPGGRPLYMASQGS